MLTYLTCLVGLCVFGSWSFYHVIYALMRGQVRRFGRRAVSSPADSGYCVRAAEPGWFWYHISIYALQGILAFVLPICMLFKMLPLFSVGGSD
jgi:hypothetical protein